MSTIHHWHLVVLRLSSVRHIYSDATLSRMGEKSILAPHRHIFGGIYDETQLLTFAPFIWKSLFPVMVCGAVYLGDFFLIPQHSRHHAVDDRTHNSVTKCCFSYTLNFHPAQSLREHHWANKSKSRPWLWVSGARCIGKDVDISVPLITLSSWDHEGRESS